MTMHKYFAAAATAALLATPVSAQMFGEDHGTDLTQERFQTGFGETGAYGAWDRDDNAMLDENEFATGVYSTWDADNDLRITEREFEAGADRWFGEDFETAFSDWDADGDGVINQRDFAENWDRDYYAEWDVNRDEMLDEQEFGSGVYETADLDSDQVITIEEEGWFEGWFDGDDIEAEIEEVGDIY